MTANRIWLAALLVVCTVFVPAVSWAETFTVSRTDALIGLIRQAMQQQYQIPAHDVLIIWNDQDLEQKLAQMGSGLSVELSDQELHNLIQRDSLNLKVMQGTRYKGRVPIRIKVDGWVEVYRSNRPISKGDVLRPDSLTAQRLKLSALPVQAIRPPFRMEDFVARQDISANTVLRPTLLVERPLVERGNEVRVILVNQNLRLVAQGEALETGVRNAMIRVKVLNFNTNKILRARVTDVGEVTLEIDG
ncbi:MAG: flagellar basal body P-ring formation chaperone FlgA [Candidatus Sericytochromatia bacterium]